MDWVDSHQVIDVVLVGIFSVTLYRYCWTPLHRELGDRFSYSFKIQHTDLHRPSTVIIQLGKVNLITLCYDPLTVL